MTHIKSCEITSILFGGEKQIMDFNVDGVSSEEQQSTPS